MENITNAEWKVMKVIWTKGRTTSSEVTDLLKSRLDWKPSTVKTLLNRLVEKDFLKTNKDGNKFIYSPLITENQSTKYLAQETMEKICAMKVPDFIEELIENGNFTKDDLDQLEQVIKNKRKDTVEKVTCNCLEDQCHCEK